MVKNLTRGNPLRIIIGISVPIFISYIVQQMYNMADTAVVGQMVGSSALAAVGATGNIYNFILSLLMGLTQGFAVIVSNRFGADLQKGVKQAIFHSLVLVGAIAALLTVPSVIFLKSFLRFMNTPPEILESAYSYIVVIVAGMIITASLNLVYALLRSLGDTRTPLFFLLISAVLNVVLDILFVKIMKNGVAAVAYATIFTQLLVLIACGVYVRKKLEIFRFEASDRRLDGETVRQLLRIGVPMALQGAITQIGFLALQSTINTFGVDVIAGYTVGNKLEQFCLQPLNTFGSAMAVYVGQNHGAGQWKRIRKGVRVSVCLTLGTALCLGAILRLFGPQLLGLFVDQNDTAVIRYGLQYVNTYAFFLSGVGMIFLFRNILQGMENVAIPMAVGVLELAARLVWVLILRTRGSYEALCFVNPVTWVMAALPLIFGYVFIIYGKKRREKGAV